MSLLVPDRTERGLPNRELLAAAATCTVAQVALVVWGVALLQRHRHGVGPPVLLADDAAVALVGLLLAVAGLLIVAHRSGRAVGWLLLASGPLLVVARVAAVAVAARPGSAVTALAVLLVRIPVMTLVTVVIAMLPMLFPSGRLPRRALRWYGAAVAVWGALRAYLDLARHPEPFGVPNPLVPGATGGTVRELSAALDFPIAMTGPLLLAVTLAVMVPRWRRGGGPPWWQTVAFIVPFAVWVTALTLDRSMTLEGWPRLGLLGGSALGWAVALACVFTRDRIWVIDRPTRRLLTAFVLVTGVILVYGAVIAVVTAARWDGRGTAVVLPACLIFAAGAALRPTARWCARAVDRLYYGERSRPYQLARDLAERLSRTVRPQDAPALLCATAVDDLRLPGARLVVPTQGGARELAAAGRPADPARHDGGKGPEEEFELAYDGAVIGHLRVRPRDAGALDGQDREVLRFLADQAAPAVASLRLYEDLRAGREQLLTARETERWRLRRDIHDGIGPALSALRLRIDTARAAVPDGSGASASLGQISGHVADLIDEVRRISAGLVPGALADVGLGPAVRGLAERLAGTSTRIDVRLRPDPLPPLPAALETAAYRIAAEAITNLVRHARARHALVTLSADGSAVRVGVRDDGIGITPHRPSTGVGLQSMAERAAELGGTFDISSGARGTIVRARLPWTAPDPAP
ncbi:sensor histidine kinase [Actinomadura graeca]|uniref:Sensor histidine kinase n=1 Tax=Actinomadura graeca TaxID=2750812 RepID=A0ABX8R3B2_9ACTN|nr:sensor histidine kinase [Actinomadura graeca]QXJ24759.1 sensor histidine kinase [Actinomadura graeca]